MFQFEVVGYVTVDLDDVIRIARALPASISNAVNSHKT